MQNSALYGNLVHGINVMAVKRLRMRMEFRNHWVAEQQGVQWVAATPLILPWAFDSDEMIVMTEGDCIGCALGVRWVVRRLSRLPRSCLDPVLKPEGYLGPQADRDVKPLAGSESQTRHLQILWIPRSQKPEILIVHLMQIH